MSYTARDRELRYRRPVVAFSKSRQRSRSIDSRVSAQRTDRQTYREVERANHWQSAPPAAVPGFGQPWHLVPLGRFPSRNFGQRTPIVMRSMLHQVLILSSSRPGLGMLVEGRYRRPVLACAPEMPCNRATIAPATSAKPYGAPRPCTAGSSLV